MNKRICFRIFLILGLAVSLLPQSNAAEDLFATERFEFLVDGQRLVGLFDVPPDPLATIILVHGYGETRVLEENAWSGLRRQFASLGLNVLVWDKPGCGESEGEFDINQPVSSSTEEVVAAVRALKTEGRPGTDRIGLWGISRAGWIAPLALQAEPDLAFWISVSGPDGKENARYLLETNLRIEGRTEAEVRALIAEWQAGFDAAWQGGSYADYLAATPGLRADPFMHFMGWGGAVSEADFLDYQARFASGELQVDPESQLQIYVPDFEEVLSSIDRPVLALFGEKDTNVDWRSTSALYRATIGANPEALLTIVTLADANHNLQPAVTGGIREMRALAAHERQVPEYQAAMTAWLIEQGFAREPVMKGR